jgi:hypothetical protein
MQHQNTQGGLLMGNIVQLNEAEIKGQLEEMVKKSVEETLNSLPDAEAD